MKEKYLKLGFVLILVFLLLTVGFCVKEISKFKKEITAFQKEREELVRDYWKSNGLINEYEKEIRELKEKAETKIEPEENLTPREVVERFIKADMAGARLRGWITENALEIEKYLSRDAITFWFFDEMMVVIKYEILEDYSSKDENSYYVKVKYFCKEGVGFGSMGIPEEVEKNGIFIAPCESFFKYDCPFCFKKSTEISSIRVFDLQKKTETVTFELIKENGQWKLNSPSICPHISEETLKKHLEALK